MEIYKIKKIKYSFAILATEHSLNLIKDTANSIKFHYPEASIITVVDGSATTEEIQEIKKICPTYKGKDTISSLINVGMRHASGDWVFLVFAGSIVRQKLDEKFSFYISSEKDILYPVANRKYDFVEATMNGLFMNKKTFKEVGEFIDGDPLDVVKAEWAMAAVNHGCKFKAILGSKMC